MLRWGAVSGTIVAGVRAQQHSQLEASPWRRYTSNASASRGTDAHRGGCLDNETLRSDVRNRTRVLCDPLLCTSATAPSPPPPPHSNEFARLNIDAFHCFFNVSGV